MSVLKASFFQNTDVVFLAKSLLGKVIFTSSNGLITAGIIVETESYKGTTDKACHAYGGRFTKRTKTMFKDGGIAYIYLCYGIHHLLNIVTNKKGIPEAVLIRAIEPIIGTDIMMQRRKKDKLSYNLTAGPGALTKALNVTTKHDGINLDDAKIWIEDRSPILEENIISSPRVGVSYAQEDALLPFRFRIKDNPWTSKAK